MSTNSFLYWGLPLTTADWDLAAGESYYFDGLTGPLDIRNPEVVDYYDTKIQTPFDANQIVTWDLKSDLFGSTSQSVINKHPVTSGYAYDAGYKQAVGYYHAGLDFRARVGDDVFSPVDGTVTKVGGSGQNRYVVIEDDIQHERWIIGHIAASVKADDRVSAGDTKIGDVVRHLQGSHVHVEVQTSDPTFSSNNFGVGGSKWGNDESIDVIHAWTQSPIQAYYELNMFEKYWIFNDLYA